mgnify:CR=1 FL=1
MLINAHSVYYVLNKPAMEVSWYYGRYSSVTMLCCGVSFTQTPVPHPTQAHTETVIVPFVLTGRLRPMKVKEVEVVQRRRKGGL